VRKLRKEVVIAGIPFESDEINGMIIAVSALIFAFTWPTVLKLPLALAVALLAFPPHEFAHKLIAFTYRYTTKFRADPLGIISLLLTSFLTNSFLPIGFSVGSAGYVEILERRVEKDHVANIALAGPLINILTGLLLAAISDVQTSFLSFIPAFIYMKSAALTCIGIGIFNLLPINEFDGRWVISYSKKWWFLAIGLGIFSFLLVLFT
jgi:Zn-dependent protease